MGAAHRGDDARVAWLLQQGADPAATDADGAMALHHAFRSAEYNTYWDPQPLASPEMTRTAMTLVAAMVARGTPFTTPLMAEDPFESKYNSMYSAAMFGCLPVVRALLDAGVPADPDPRDNERETPLAAAAVGAHIPVVSLLLAAGADVNRQFLPGSFRLR